MKCLSALTVCACCTLLNPVAFAGPDNDHDHGHDHDAQHAEAAAKPAMVHYTLGTCAISGEKLGSMGDAIVKVYDGREVKFCCSMCVPKFEKDLEASFANLDEQIIESQLPFYPTPTCVVSGEALGGGEMGDPINMVHNGRLVRLCCLMCTKDFNANPESYIAKLDEAVIAQQSEHYPLTACPVSGEELGSMGDAIEVVYAGRLVKFCCSMCLPKFEKDPMATISKIDAAWMAMHEDADGHQGHEMKNDQKHDHDDGDHQGG